jgi:zinc transport system permease protein
MMEFLDALMTAPFLQYALIAGLGISVACGVVGTYVVVRRMSYMAGGIAHCTLGGIGLAMYLQKVHGLTFITPLGGAVAAALLAALVIGFVSLRLQQREDTVISALWALGMAMGALFIYITPGFKEDLFSYLFGNILMVSPSDLWVILGLDVVVLTLSIAFYRPFQAICFDEEFARTRGLHVEFYFLLLLCLTALTVVLLVTVVGIVMVIALLTLPVAVAGQFADRLWKMMAISVALIVVYTTAGLALSYGPDLPSGAVIILLAGGVYLVSLLVRWLRGRFRRKEPDEISSDQGEPACPVLDLPPRRP